MVPHKSATVVAPAFKRRDLGLGIGEKTSEWRLIWPGLLGHKKLDTTALYTRVAISTIGQVTSPLDFLRKMPG